MKGIAFSGWLAVVLCAVAGCAAHSVNAQGKAVAPIGSWKGTVVAFDLGSDGRASYKDLGVAEFTGRWEWLPTTQDAGNLVLTPPAPSSANPLQFPIIWLNKNALRFCDAKGHCDTLSRRGEATSGIAPEPFDVAGSSLSSGIASDAHAGRPG